MQATTMNDREKELRGLLQELKDHPERERGPVQQRVNVLREMLAGKARS